MDASTRCGIVGASTHLCPRPWMVVLRSDLPRHLAHEPLLAIVRLSAAGHEFHLFLISNPSAHSPPPNPPPTSRVAACVMTLLAPFTLLHPHRHHHHRSRVLFDRVDGCLRRVHA